jgi:iron complex outermembrane receptor protein
LEWEIERSERQQFGVNGYSLLGDALPAPVDGKRNLTRQSWSVPAVFAGTTGTIRFKQNLDNGWLWTTQYGGQRLKTDDNLTFAWGSNVLALGLSFPADQNADLWDFRSLNEKRIADTLQTEVSGTANWAGYTHQWSMGVQRNRSLDRLPPLQAWNGAGNLNSSSANATPTLANINRTEYATEWSLKDRITINDKNQVWLGLRHVQYERSSEQNDPPGNRRSHIQGQASSPWLAWSTQMADSTAYISHGYGIEQFVTPNNSVLFANAGEQLGVKKSVQTEIGIRHPAQGHGLEWSATAFHIERPLTYDIIDRADYRSTRFLDGQLVHVGADASLGWRNAHWTLQGQAQIIKARLNNVQLHPEIGSRPLNVPALTLRAQAQYRFTDLPGLRASLRLSHEGSRQVTEDGRIQLPSWTTADLAAHYDSRIKGTATQWTLAIDNLADRHYWRESPKQFAHYYLYPGAPRTLRLGVRFSL